MTEIKKLIALVRRNMACYFKDKILFFVSLLTPLILLVLYVTFLRAVYLNSFEGIFELFAFEPVSQRQVEGLAGAWLLSSILAVCSVTVAVCSNAVMVSDRADGTVRDLTVSPVSSVTLSLSYFIANYIVTLIVMFAVLALGFVYLGAVGWYLTAKSVLLIVSDIFLSVLFGTLVAGVLESFISSQGGMSAISSLVSSLYGFLCGAYMPLSQFAAPLRNLLGFFPGTYSVGILRAHFMGDYVDALMADGMTAEAGKALMDAFDGNLYVFGTQMPHWAMILIVVGTCLLLLGGFAAIVAVRSRRR